MDRNTIKDMCDFVDASPTAYHAADNIATTLSACGARELPESGVWELEPGVLYFVRRGGSAVIAFRTGLVSPAESGFALAGAHTDSPALKARLGKVLEAKGMERIPVEIYGGPIVSTWLDRPLSLAGRVALRSGEAITSLLYNSAKPVGLIPNLAIHLNREVNKGFEYNSQNHLPVLVEALAQETGKAGENGTGWLRRRLALDLGIDAANILAADLFFVEGRPAVVIGELDNCSGSLVNGSRLDDLAGCHAVLQALLAASPAMHGQLACFMDAEEIGSRTAQGADSSFMRDTLARICLLSGCDSQGFYRALARSFSVSVDVAQAWHPSYGDKYDEGFAPLLNGGPAVKANANFKYATDSESEAAIRVYCSRIGVPCQKFMSRSDIIPGSTIGPMSSALTGIKTVDIGHPLLSMHSIRETIGTRDHESMTALILEHYRAMAVFGAR